MKRIMMMIKTYIASKSKINVVFDVTTYFLFFLSFLSIPAFSFIGGLSSVTWVITIAMFAMMGLSLLIFYKASFDYIGASMILFAVSALFSSLLNGFNGFNLTPILLSITSFIIYVYAKANKDSKSVLLFLTYIATIVFGFIFCFKYRHELIHLSSLRLGDYFGDQNDIALFFGLGACFAFYYLFFGKSLIVKIINFLSLFAFGYCGVSTGSKIFILIVIVAFILCFIFYFKNKKLWVSLTVLGATLTVGIVLLFLPFMSFLRDRIFSFISTLSGQSIGGGKTNDYSTIDRFNMFLDGMNLFTRKPLFGFGIWGFATYGGYGDCWSHNHFSESLCNYGIVGTVLFSYCYVISIVQYFKTPKDERNKYWLPLIIISLFTCAMFSVALHTQKIYAYVIGVLVSFLAGDNSKNIFVADLKKLRGSRHVKNS